MWGRLYPSNAKYFSFLGIKIEPRNFGKSMIEMEYILNRYQWIYYRSEIICIPRYLELNFFGSKWGGDFKWFYLIGPLHSSQHWINDNYKKSTRQGITLFDASEKLNNTRFEPIHHDRRCQVLINSLNCFNKFFPKTIGSKGRVHKFMVNRIKCLFGVKG